MKVTLKRYKFGAQSKCFLHTHLELRSRPHDEHLYFLGLCPLVIPFSQRMFIILMRGTNKSNETRLNATHITFLFKDEVTGEDSISRTAPLIKSMCFKHK